MNPTINEASVVETPNAAPALFVLAPHDTVDQVLTVSQNATIWPQAQCFMVAGGKLVAFDGTAACVAVAPIAIDATAGDVDFSVYVEGEFSEPALIREAAVADPQTFLNALAGSRITAKTPIS